MSARIAAIRIPGPDSVCEGIAAPAATSAMEAGKGKPDGFREQHERT